MKQLLFVLFVPLLIQAQPTQKPGSGNAITLTETGSLSTSPYINAGSGFDFGTMPFTFETWVKRDSITTALNDFGKVIIIGNLNNSWGIGFQNNNTIFFTRVGFSNVNSTGAITDKKWHHIAVIFTGTQVRFYIDGILSGSPSYTVNFNNTAGDYLIGPRQSSGNSNGDQTLDGRVDEMKIWNIALTQDQIRSRMCAKIKPSDILFSNLVLYYNMDENSGNTVFDGSTNNHNGTFFNNPIRVVSGAAIGNASANDYLSATKNVTINHPTGESFNVNTLTGNPLGIQVYRVDEQPNTLTGTQGVGSNNKYFGVFSIGDTNATFNTIYNYDGNPGVNVTNENSLLLYNRNNNSDTLWVNSGATLNTTSNNLSTIGKNAEYILGKTGIVLPLKFLYFNAFIKNSAIVLDWQTENEINTEKFIIERGTTENNFKEIGIVKSKNTIADRYTYNDNIENLGTKRLYYRIKQVDKDGEFTYSKILDLKINIIVKTEIFPNPATSSTNVKLQLEHAERVSIKVVCADGKVLTITTYNLTRGSNLIPINIQHLTKGIYAIIIAGQNINERLTFSKQ